jgi:hypothetical protein
VKTLFADPDYRPKEFLVEGSKPMIPSYQVKVVSLWEARDFEIHVEAYEHWFRMIVGEEKPNETMIHMFVTARKALANHAAATDETRAWMRNAERTV